MSTRYVLIDYENVQPETLEGLNPSRDVVLILAGPNSPRKLETLVADLHRFHKNSKLIKMAGKGRNALDRLLAFYLGQLAARRLEVSFCVVAKDKGYDPLIQHMKQRKFTAQRIDTLDTITGKKRATTKPSTSSALSVKTDLQQIVENLRKRGKSQPSSLKTLGTTINEMYRNKLPEHVVSQQILGLMRQDVVSVSGNKIKYNFLE